MMPYGSTSLRADLEAWLVSTDSRQLVEIIAAAFARAIGVPQVDLSLNTDADAPYVLIVARTHDTPDVAVRKLVEFTGSEWWCELVRRTAGAFLVDVECY